MVMEKADAVLTKQVKLSSGTTLKHNVTPSSTIKNSIQSHRLNLQKHF